MNRALRGVTVIDLTEVWAGPMGTSLLGDLGATVIKVESFPRVPTTRIVGGPAARGFTNNDAAGPRPWDRAAIHNMANRNKYGVTLNLAHPRGLAVFERLAAITDVVCEAYAAGAMERLGVGYQRMKEVKPDIVMVSMPGWGVQGPYKGYVSLGSGIDGFTGHHALRGYPGTDPTVTPVAQHADAVGAVTLAFAVLAALYHRNRTGEGQWVDVSQVEAFLPHLGRPFMDHVMNGRPFTPAGNRDDHMAPHGCYPCSGDDNWVAITVSSDSQWRALVRVMGDPDWARDPAFSDSLSRHRNQDLLDRHIREWTGSRDKKAVVSTLQEAGVPAQAVLDDVDLYSDPHLAARGFFQRIQHPVIGEHRYPGYLWTLGGSSPPVDIPPATYGEHNRYVYGTLLGMTDEEMDDLEGQGVIGDEVVEIL